MDRRILRDPKSVTVAGGFIGGKAVAEDAEAGRAFLRQDDLAEKDLAAQDELVEGGTTLPRCVGHDGQ